MWVILAYMFVDYVLALNSPLKMGSSKRVAFTSQSVLLSDNIHAHENVPL